MKVENHCDIGFNSSLQILLFYARILILKCKNLNDNKNLLVLFKNTGFNTSLM